MLFKIVARNKKTLEVIEWLGYKSERLARWAIANNLEWEEDDIPEDWEFSILPYEENDYYEEPDDADDECGFDPYCGCYTYDC